MWIITIGPYTYNVSLWMTDTHTCGDHIHIIRHLHAFDMPIQYAKLMLLPPQRWVGAPATFNFAWAQESEMIARLWRSTSLPQVLQTHVFERHLYQYAPQMLIHATHCDDPNLEKTKLTPPLKCALWWVQLSHFKSWPWLFIWAMQWIRLPFPCLCDTLDDPRGKTPS